MLNNFDISGINKIFENRIRLGVMSILSVNEEIDFNTLKSVLDVTDGNLSSHVSALENEGFLNIKKQFVGKKPKTTFTITEAGRKAFTEHLDALEKLIKIQSK